MSFLDELLKLGLRQALVIDTQLDSEAEAATLARTDGNSTRHLGLLASCLCCLPTKSRAPPKHAA